MAGDEELSPPSRTGAAMFQDRRSAGARLAKDLARYKDENPIVLALPRGGVPVGYEVARALGAPLDVYVVRKLGAPQQPELGIGALAPGDVLVLDNETIRLLGITREEVALVVERERAEMERRLLRFRGDRPLLDLKDRTVILVDDGLATGVTAYAAVQALRTMEPRKIVLAVPVCAVQTARVLRAEVSDLVCLSAPDDFGAVGIWYKNFDQTTDDEVIRLLQGED
jgi:predicted phosphoribosyltransferase